MQFCLQTKGLITEQKTKQKKNQKKPQGSSSTYVLVGCTIKAPKTKRSIPTTLHLVFRGVSNLLEPFSLERDSWL
jgi:hypothetical protein